MTGCRINFLGRDSKSHKHNYIHRCYFIINIVLSLTYSPLSSDMWVDKLLLKPAYTVNSLLHGCYQSHHLPFESGRRAKKPFAYSVFADRNLQMSLYVGQVTGDIGPADWSGPAEIKPLGFGATRHRLFRQKCLSCKTLL